MNFKSYTIHTVEELSQCGIYAIVNKVNGKFYIGSAGRVGDCNSGSGFYSRWFNHVNTLKTKTHHSPLLQRAWDKYGADNFKFQILEFVEPERCIEVEQMYLDLFPAGDRALVYNICFTAGSILGVKRSEETRKKISEARSKEYYIVSPEGIEYKGKNLREFCRKNKLSVKNIHQVISSQCLHSKGWTKSLENYGLYRETFDIRGITCRRNNYSVRWCKNRETSIRCFKTLEEAKAFRNLLEETEEHKFKIRTDDWKNKINAKENS